MTLVHTVHAVSQNNVITLLFVYSSFSYTTLISEHYILLTYLRSSALLEKLPIVQLLKNFPPFYGTQKFITMFTRALHWSLS
jgi:hypothetical protein